jgi:hypothetical protein
MTTGGNPTSDRMTATTRGPGRSAAVQAAIDKPLMSMAENVGMMHAGVSATATVVSAIGIHATRSPGMSACRADWSANWFVAATANTRCAAPNRERLQPLVRSEWSPVVIFATTTAVPLIHAPATSGTSANKG